MPALSKVVVILPTEKVGKSLRLKGEGQARESRREEEQDIPPLREAVTSSDSVNQAASLAAVKHSLVRCSSCQQLRFFLEDLFCSGTNRSTKE